METILTRPCRGRMPLAGRALALVTFLALATSAQASDPAAQGEGGAGERFKATAYAVDGETATGAQTKEGIVAADPDVLPLGSRIRVHDAGPYSGEYVVKDVGRSVDGKHVDLFLESESEAKKFGERTVRVEVLERGPGKPSAAAEKPLPAPEARAPAVR